MSQTERVGPFTRFPNRLQWEEEGERFWIDPYGPSTLRFRSSRSLRIAEQDWNLIPQSEAKLEIWIDENRAIVTNGTLRAEIRAWDGRVRYLNEQGSGIRHPVKDDLLASWRYLDECHQQDGDRRGSNDHGAGFPRPYPGVLQERCRFFTAVREKRRQLIRAGIDNRHPCLLLPSR